MPRHSLHHERGLHFPSLAPDDTSLFEQLPPASGPGVRSRCSRPRRECSIQSPVLGVVGHDGFDIENSELHVPIGRGIEQDRRHTPPKPETDKRRSAYRKHISDIAVDAVVQR